MAFYLAGVGLAVVLAGLAYVVTDWCGRGRRVLLVGEKSRPVELV
ncbi:hypothetical protein [Micromonospora sp. DT47]